MSVFPLLNFWNSLLGFVINSVSSSPSPAFSFGKSPIAFCGFKAHSAPLGFEYMKNFADEDIANSFLVCLHGSTKVSRQRGNAIVKITGANNYTTVIDGFLTGKTAKDRHGRPCDILMNDAHSFFFTDDLNGVLYFVWK